MSQKEYSYGVNGNTAVKPLKKTTIRKPKKHSEIIKKKKDNKKKLFKKQRQSDRKYILTVVMFILSIGCITIAGYSNVYKMQRAVTKLEDEINNTREENEALRVKILKYSSLNNIEETAGNSLGMYVPHDKDVIKIDFSNDYFKDVKVNSNVVKKDDNDFLLFLEKIFS